MPHLLTTLRHRRLTRAVSLAMLFALWSQLLAPTLIERLLPRNDSALFLSVCSSTGLRMLPAAYAAPGDGTPDEQPGTAASHTNSHCVLCALGQAWLPPAHDGSTLHRLQAPSLPRFSLVLNHTGQHRPWAHLPARAPPLRA